MKLLIWAGTLLVAVFWTLTIALTASLSNWLATSSDKAVGGLQTITQWPTPPWLALWVDPALLAPLKDLVVWSVNLLVMAGPWLTPLLDWVAPLLWVVWAVVMLLLLAVAGGAHFFVGKLRQTSGSGPGFGNRR